MPSKPWIMVCRVTSFVRIDSQYLAAVTTQHPCPSDPEKKKAYMQGMGKKGWVIGLSTFGKDWMSTPMLHSGLAWREARSSMISCYHA